MPRNPLVIEIQQLVLASALFLDRLTPAGIAAFRTEQQPTEQFHIYKICIYTASGLRVLWANKMWHCIHLSSNTPCIKSTITSHSLVKARSLPPLSNTRIDISLLSKPNDDWNQKWDDIIRKDFERFWHIGESAIYWWKKEWLLLLSDSIKLRSLETLVYLYFYQWSQPDQ